MKFVYLCMLRRRKKGPGKLRLHPLMCETLRNGKFHSFHAQSNGFPGTCFTFFQLTISSLIIIWLSIKFSTLKQIIQVVYRFEIGSRCTHWARVCCASPRERERAQRDSPEIGHDVFDCGRPSETRPKIFTPFRTRAFFSVGLILHVTSMSARTSWKA
jgi:hypothetical protein